MMLYFTIKRITRHYLKIQLIKQIPVFIQLYMALVTLQALEGCISMKIYKQDSYRHTVRYYRLSTENKYYWLLSAYRSKLSENARVRSQYSTKQVFAYNRVLYEYQ